MRPIIVSICVLTLFLSATSSQSQTAFDILFAEKEKYADVVVDKVLTVDTFVLKDGEQVRLIGLKAPEMPPRKKDERPEVGDFGFVMERRNKHLNPVEDIEVTALEYVKELLEGKHIRLEFDTNKTSDDFKTLAYVYLLEDDTLVNTEILRMGYAHLSIQLPNTKHAKLLRDAYRESREQRRGLQSQ